MSKDNIRENATLRDPENVQPYVDGQVLVSFADNPKISLNGEFGEDWETVGILADGSKVELTRAIDKNKTKGWGYGVVAVSTKPGELTGKASVIERNATVDKIAWPDTVTPEEGEANGVVLLHSEKVALCHVAMIGTTQDGKQKITVTRHKAIATIANLSFGEDPEGKDIEFDFQTGKLKDAFDEITIDAPKITDGEVKPIRFVTSLEEEEEEESQVKTVTLPSEVSGGTFTLSIDNQKSAAIDHDATASAVQLILRKVKGGEKASVTGSKGGPYTVKGIKGNLTADGASLTGGDSNTVTVR
ncbi:hypothetical protein NG01_04300 [Corynebacterium diphtheriae]|uniref:hypothetical protein n=1 Tax=Corynebacterium diphtheriae TaxID=1717 RepID=UPI0005EAFE05|nr:hypothetical protein [Corynebacterium diphtheriae]KJJ60007.1 hypothetical protein NG01_04300 [Corynebacterium diphtheriae]